MKPMLLNRFRALTVVVAAVVFCTLAPVAYADQYIGIDGSVLSFDDDLGDNENLAGARLRLGIQLNNWFDLEAQVGGGEDDSRRTFNPLSVTYFGVYLKGYLPIGQRISLFALAGGGAVELTQTIGRREFSDDGGGFSYGFGLETQLSEYWDLTADYMRYTLNNDNLSDISTVNLGLKFYF